jgi:heptosyltransferase III
MEWLKADYTEVWAPSANLPLIRFADRTRSLASTGVDLVGVTEPALEAFGEFDSIVSWYGTNRPEFRAAVEGLPFEFHAALPDGSCHAVDFYARQVGAPDGLAPRIDTQTETPPKEAVAIHPFSGSASKNWPLERFHELVARLTLPVEFFYGPEQIKDLYELAGRLAGAALYVGNDSGITHLATAVGTPVIALFGPTDPLVWAPRGARVLHRERIADISVDEVLSAIADFGEDHPELSIVARH